MNYFEGMFAHEPAPDVKAMTEHELDRIIHHFEYGSFQRNVVVPRRMYEQRPQSVADGFEFAGLCHCY
ncbi:MAG: hypothetical protein WA624_10130 [Methylocella sp.]